MKVTTKLLTAISADVYDEGVIGNCRWMYSPTDNSMAPGVLSLAFAIEFDRWANSRIVVVYPRFLCANDPDFGVFITKLVEAF